MKTREEMRFEATMQFLIHKFTYPNKELAIRESIEMADKLLDILEYKDEVIEIKFEGDVG